MKIDHKKEKEKIFLFLIFFLFSVFLFTEGSDLKIRVTVSRANIRLKPSLESMVITQVKGGQILEVLDKVQNWYQVNLPPDEKGIVISGYIHQSIVEEIKKVIPQQKKITPEEKTEKPVEGKVVPSEKTVIPESKEASPQIPQTDKRKPQIQKPGHKKFFIRLGGGYASRTYSYAKSWSFVLYQEDGQVSENYNIDSSGFAFDAGFGLFFFRNVGIEVSFVPASGKTMGNFSAEFPHPFYFNLYREANWEKADLQYSSPEIHFNLIFSFPLSPRMDIYLTGGGTYFTEVKIENLKVIHWNETGYPYFELSTNPEYASYGQSCFGFNAGAGMDFFLMDSVGLNLNLRYASGEVKIDVEGTEVAVKPGGFRATAGIKFAL